jgi:hypothetical protein
MDRNPLDFMQSRSGGFTPSAAINGPTRRLVNTSSQEKKLEALQPPLNGDRVGSF